jgi:hypothetical protein
MRRIVIAPLLATILALAPAAAAKGPHATVSSGPTGIDPGKPWVTTLTLVEFGGRELAAARPTVILRSGTARFSVRPRLVGATVPSGSDVLGEARYRLRVVFPRAGRWSYTVVDGTRANRHFRFPMATIGGNADRLTTGYVAFPVGSAAHSQGGGGPIMDPPDPAASEPEGALPPEVVLPPDDEPDGDGFPLWIPAAGLTLAGLGIAVRARRRSD